MSKLNEVVLATHAPYDDESISMSFNAKCQITGRFKEILSLSGSEDEWESFITRLRKHLAKVRANVNC